MKFLKHITLLLVVALAASLFIGAKASAPRRDDTFAATGGMAVTPANTDIVFPVWAAEITPGCSWGSD